MTYFQSLALPQQDVQLLRSEATSHPILQAHRAAVNASGTGMATNPKAGAFQRLKNFYKYWSKHGAQANQTKAAERLALDDSKINATLTKYEGSYEKMFRILIQKYGPEPTLPSQAKPNCTHKYFRVC